MVSYEIEKIKVVDEITMDAEATIAPVGVSAKSLANFFSFSCDFSEATSPTTSSLKSLPINGNTLNLSFMTTGSTWFHRQLCCMFDEKLTSQA